MGTLECVKKGFSVAKRSSELLLILFIAAFVEGVLGLPFQQAATPDAATISAPQVVISLFFRLIGVYLFGGALLYIANVVRQGESSFNDFKEGGKQYFLRMLIITIVFAVALVMIRILIQSVMNLAGGIANPVAVLVSLLVTVALFVAFSFIMMAPYAVIASNQNVKEAFQSSISFVKQNLSKVMGVAVVIFVIAIGLGFLVGAVLGVLSNLLSGFAASISNIFILSLFTTYIQVVAFGALTALYISQQPQSIEASAAE